jgi:hexokinase
MQHGRPPLSFRYEPLQLFFLATETIEAEQYYKKLYYTIATRAAHLSLVFICSLLEAEGPNYRPALHSIVKELFSSF